MEFVVILLFILAIVCNFISLFILLNIQRARKDLFL